MPKNFSELKTASKGTLVDAINSQKYFVSIAEFPRTGAETDDSPRIQRAIASMPQGGRLVFEVAEYTLATTITVPPNITIEGQGFGRFHTGTTFKYTGTGAAFKYPTSGATAGAQLKNFKIIPTTGNLKNYTGIDVNRGELVGITDVMVLDAKVGIDITGNDGPVYLLKIDNIFIYNCAQEGIYIRTTGAANPNNWKNGVYIGVGDISDCEIGIRCGLGNGNTIEGKASEIGRNRTGGILIEKGFWTIKGNFWIEGSPYGIKTTGGHTNISDDLYNINKIEKAGGSLQVSHNQTNVGYVSASMIKRGLLMWYSFEEGTGLNTYDRTNGYKATFSAAPTWNPDPGQFGSTVQPADTKMISLPFDKIDWTKDWTMLLLGKGLNTKSLMAAQGSDNVKTISFKAYPNGTQMYVNGSFVKNFQTFPNGDATVTMNWHILSYNAATTTVTAYNQNGVVHDSFVVTIDPTLSAPTYLRLVDSSVIDEFLVYDRVLADSEIRAITQLRIPPDVRSTDHQVIKSPDGSMFKLTVDNAGGLTTTKL